MVLSILVVVFHLVWTCCCVGWTCVVVPDVRVSVYSCGLSADRFCILAVDGAVHR
jgi:hypothetical protein